MKKVASILAVFMGSQPSGYQKNHKRNQCKLCNYSGIETNVHIIFECNALETNRPHLWNNVLLSMPESLKSDVLLLSNLERVNLMLSCYNETYVPEWIDLYRTTANFIHAMYVYRSEAYDVLELT